MIQSANSDLSNLLNLPPTIAVRVVSYGTVEEQEILSFAPAEKFRAIVNSTLKIPTAEFAANFLFYQRQLGMPDYARKIDAAADITQMLAMLARLIQFTDTSLISAVPANLMPTEITEHIGEAIGLSVLNRLHDLTLADWTKIRQNRGKHKVIFDFDTSKASDGRSYIELEAKGACVPTNKKSHANIHQQRSEIRKKKNKSHVPTEEREAAVGHYSIHVVRRYGAITSIPQDSDDLLLCRLTDPPAEVMSPNPLVAKLLIRMRFLVSWISLIRPRSSLATALVTRTRDLEELSDPFELDGLKLIKFETENFEEPFLIPSSVFLHSLGESDRLLSKVLGRKARVSDNSGGGTIWVLSTQYVFFIGIRDELVELAINQNFKDILEFGYDAISATRSLVGALTKTQVVQLGLEKFADPKTGYLSFSVRSQIHYSVEGIVFSIIPVDELRKGNLTRMRQPYID